jgi:RsiW-degrading membrane proteinase PrsW (M82 family)
MWHYVDGTRQTRGPVQREELLALYGKGQLNDLSLVWREGMPGWVPMGTIAAELGLPPPMPGGPAAAPPAGPFRPAAAAPASAGNPWSVQGFANKVTDLVGLERIEGFSAKEMLAAIFHRYGPEAIETYFSVGLKETTPPLEQVTTKWPKPWMFARALGFSLLLYVGFVMAMTIFKADIALPAVIITGSFAVPLATLIFFFEMNAPQNVSLYHVLRLLMLGGLLSIASSLLLFDLTVLDDWIGAPSAGVIEEIGKLAAVIWLTRKMDPKRYPYILNGLLFGAAVGTGFAAFESAGYALMITLQEQSAAAGNFNIVLRGILAPFGHVVWTAIAAGALWSVKQDQPFRFGMLFQRRPLTLLLAVMALHFTWNLPFAGPFLLKYWVLGFIAWVLVFALVQSGLKQLRAARTVNHTMTRGMNVEELRAALANKLKPPR